MNACRSQFNKNNKYVKIKRKPFEEGYHYHEAVNTLLKFSCSNSYIETPDLNTKEITRSFL